MRVQSSPASYSQASYNPLQRGPITFRGHWAEPANHFVDWFVRNLYDRGEGVRYAVEQTLGYTVPRTIQQLNRTRGITGEANPQAAEEMLMRDLAADFADTFLPGLLATFGIGALLDRLSHTYVGHNFGHQALMFYQQQASGASKSQFFQNIETALTDYARKTTQQTEFPAIGLADRIAKVTKPNQMAAVAEELAGVLKLPHLDLTLSAIPKTLNESGHVLETTLPELLQDLWHLVQPNPAIEAALESTTHALPKWGDEMSKVLAKTLKFSHYQMLGNAAALLASLSIPFGIRLFTRLKYGEDAFPGTKELERHFQAKSGQHPDQNQDQTATRKKFRLFPYLEDSLKAGQWLPTALTTVFFGVLTAMVGRRFYAQKLNPLQFKNWFKVYEFHRAFPYTTIAQMELTYGLLCGIRLASSRDRAEFRESGIRDCLLGWPTLTYGFPLLRKGLAGFFNRNLTRQFGNPNLLLKASGDIRTGAEMHPVFFKNLGVSNNLETVMGKTKLTQSWVTFVSAMVNWGLLAFAEPKLGIWLTNHLEVNRMKEASQSHRPNLEFSSDFPRQLLRKVNENSLFGAFERQLHNGAPTPQLN